MKPLNVTSFALFSFHSWNFVKAGISQMCVCACVRVRVCVKREENGIALKWDDFTFLLMNVIVCRIVVRMFIWIWLYCATYLLCVCEWASCRWYILLCFLKFLAYIFSFSPLLKHPATFFHSIWKWDRLPYQRILYTFLVLFFRVRDEYETTFSRRRGWQWLLPTSTMLPTRETIADVGWCKVQRNRVFFSTVWDGKGRWKKNWRRA